MFKIHHNKNRKLLSTKKNLLQCLSHTPYFVLLRTKLEYSIAIVCLLCQTIGFIGEGNGNPLQYYCLENPMNRGAWQATFRGVSKSWTRLSNFTSHRFHSGKSYVNFTHSCVCAQLLSHVRLFVTPWTVAYQAPQSVGFSRQEYWSGLPFPSPMHESEK